MIYEIHFSELKHGLARVEASSREEAEEMAMELYNNGKVQWVDSSITDISVAEIEHEQLSAGDSVIVFNCGPSLWGKGKIVGLADDDFDYPGTEDFFVVDFGEKDGTCTVFREHMKKIV